jgi:hypothetical protein
LKPQFLLGNRDDSLQPKSIAEFLDRFIEVLGRLNARNLNDGELWEEFLVWQKEFEIHAKELSRESQHIWCQLQEIRDDIKLFRARQADLPKPCQHAEKNWFVLHKVRPKVVHFMKLRRLLS